MFISKKKVNFIIKQIEQIKEEQRNIIQLIVKRK